MYYIDFDGVILDTYFPTFKEYYEQEKLGNYIDDIEYVQKQDWNKILVESEIINNSIDIIKSIDINRVAILTRIHSLENEGESKIKYLREKGIRCPIILVPYHLKKTDIVFAKDNILIDDAIFNLDEWSSQGGTSIYFNKDGNSIDGWGRENTKYKIIQDLNFIKNEINHKES